MYLKKLRSEFSLPRFLDQTLPCVLFQVPTQFSPRYWVLVIHFLFLKVSLEYIALVLRCVLLVVTSWTVAHQAPLSMGFPRQEYWSGFPSPGDLPDPGIEPAQQADSSPPQLPEKPDPSTIDYILSNNKEPASPSLSGHLDFPREESDLSLLYSILPTTLL